MSDIQVVDTEIHIGISMALLKSQKLEFLIHGLISHFNTICLSRHKSFKNLDPIVFLSSSDKNAKKRKQTLGEMLKLIKLEIPILHSGELKKNLQTRNDFVHNFWRNYIGSGKYNKQNSLDFITDFYDQTQYWLRIFGGLLSIFQKKAWGNLSLEEQKQRIESGKGYSNTFEKFEPFLYAEVTKNTMHNNQ